MAASYVVEKCQVHTRQQALRMWMSCDAAMAVLRPFLRDPSPLIRRTLASTRDSQLLTEMIHDPSPWVRQGVGRSLARSSTGKAKRALAAIALNDPNSGVRRTLVDVLARGHMFYHQTVLLRLCRDQEPWVRSAALQALSPTKQALKTLHDHAVSDSLPWVQYICLRELAKHNVVAAWQTLACLAGKVGWDTYAAMGRMLGHFAPPLGRCITACLRRPRENEVAWVLDRLDVSNDDDANLTERRGAINTLRFWCEAAVRSPTPPAHTLAVASALAVQKAPLDILHGWHIRPAAERFPEAMVYAAEHWLESRSTEGDERAVALLAVWNHPDAIPMLHAMVDREQSTQCLVANALFQLAQATGSHQPTDMLGALERLRCQPAEAVRALVPACLESLPGVHAVEMLAACLEDPSPEVRLAALWPAARLHTPQLVRALKPLVNDPDLRLRRELARACAYFQTEDALAMLKTLGQDSIFVVRLNAIHSLRNHCTPVGLRLLDRISTTSKGDVLQAASRVRSEILVHALESYRDDPAILAMLYRWTREITDASTAGLEKLATSRVPRRREILRQMLESRHKSVRTSALAALKTFLERL